ncbi:hypothetical protein RB2509 [Rhodopirellula baltica SH 1]|uniref:Uncharacterized protein n=1 Tax=Rhodopirellula baltica (strain DSM 10527 / NCIMB 13988 / SH1) TaxID=243090 RepID=Q7UVP2_RHOBA|nr:hypothetical protein RB2509 [Rhodopirellula baltica SH 1]
MPLSPTGWGNDGMVRHGPNSGEFGCAWALLTLRVTVVKEPELTLVG